ncbi:MAG: hypothetical protein KJ970_00040 [Candidatus Eisenbacteria bacterium]|uniref:Uncharacterized protein n=1 Tax=Eiseniibacteriota bacterium TaxID=2212470 RepID=A0A948W4T2_UNCEI|nr:hypothetical protein [Candidatus Eisenbacteria bacterium]
MITYKGERVGHVRGAVSIGGKTRAICRILPSAGDEILSSAVGVFILGEENVPGFIELRVDGGEARAIATGDMLHGEIEESSTSSRKIDRGVGEAVRSLSWYFVRIAAGGLVAALLFWKIRIVAIILITALGFIEGGPRIFLLANRLGVQDGFGIEGASYILGALVGLTLGWIAGLVLPLLLRMLSERK